MAAALSGDPLMMEAYLSGDPYLAFAKQAGAAPADATKATHKAVRDQFKSTVLAVQYGMGADALAQRIGQPPIRARELLRLHRETYRMFWRWSDAAVDHAMLTSSLHTCFGWQARVSAVSNERSLRNFPMQANGAEMLRLACCLGNNVPWHPWHPDLFRLPALQGRTRPGRRVSSTRGKFIMGPIDVAWVCQAGQLGVTALLVGLVLWHLKGLRQTNSFTISNLMVAEWGVQPDAKNRALRKLEKASLITIERRGKRSPRVTLVAGNRSEGGATTTASG